MPKICWRILGARQNSHSHSQPYRCDCGALRIHMDQSLGVLFSRKSVWTNGPEGLSKASPRLILVHGWLVPVPNSGVRKKEFQKRSFAWHVPRYVPFCLRNRKEHPKELRDTNAFSETPFPNTLSVRKRSVTKEVCTGEPGPCSQVRPFNLQNSKGIPLGTLT